MNTIKLAAMSISKKILIMLFVIIELAVLFFTENYAVTSISERTMLLAPYNKILNDSCLFVYDGDYAAKAFESADDLTTLQSQNELLEGLEGNYKLYNILTFISSQYGLICSVDDEIYRMLKIPLTKGEYGNGTNSAVASAINGEGEINVKVGSDTLTLDICGTLTPTTYVPEYNYFGNDITASTLYSVLRNGGVVITNRSSLGEAQKSFVSCNLGFFVKFDTPEAAQKGAEYFQSKGAVALKGSVLKNNTNAEIVADLSSFIPLLTCVLFIVLIGVIGISIMIFNDNRYRSGVLWLCGYSRKKIISVQAASICILLIAALAVFALLALGMNMMITNESINADKFSKMSFGLSNIAVTLITCAVLVIAAVAMPAVKTYKKSPVEYLGRAK